MHPFPPSWSSHSHEGPRTTRRPFSALPSVTTQHAASRVSGAGGPSRICACSWACAVRSPWNSETGLAPREEVEEGELELELMFPATSASSSPSDNSATERTGGVYRSLPLPPLDRDGRDKPAKSSTGTGDLSFPLLPSRSLAPCPGCGEGPLRSPAPPGLSVSGNASAA